MKYKASTGSYFLSSVNAFTDILSKVCTGFENPDFWFVLFIYLFVWLIDWSIVLDTSRHKLLSFKISALSFIQCKGCTMHPTKSFCQTLLRLWKVNPFIINNFLLSYRETILGIYKIICVLVVLGRNKLFYNLCLYNSLVNLCIMKYKRLLYFIREYCLYTEWSESILGGSSFALCLLLKSTNILCVWNRKTLTKSL